MVRRIALIAVALAMSTTLSARADDKDEWKALSGTWKVEKAVLMGNDATEAFKSVVMVLEEGKYAVEFAGEKDKGTLTLDTTKKPKRITIKSTEGTNKDKVFEAIYELKDDTLTICYALDGKDPPKEFVSKEGTMTLLATYKREKK